MVWAFMKFLELLNLNVHQVIFTGFLEKSTWSRMHCKFSPFLQSDRIMREEIINYLCVTISIHDEWKLHGFSGAKCMFLIMWNFHKMLVTVRMLWRRQWRPLRKQRTLTQVHALLGSITTNEQLRFFMTFFWKPPAVIVLIFPKKKSLIHFQACTRTACRETTTFSPQIVI